MPMVPRKVAKPGPDPVDVHIGLMIRARRKQLGMSQGKLAKQVGITYQQVQKYENAINRIAGSTLVYIAKALDVPVQHFFPEEGTSQLLPAQMKEFVRGIRTELGAIDKKLAKLM
jgi:transcriptional regulator with XRE-family HTH domain